MQDKARAMIWGACIGDAMALGAHWVYNTGVIDKKFGTVDHYKDPLASFHSGKKAGDFTHYGDQMMVLLDSLVRENGFDGQRFARRWRTFFQSYEGYFDKATKATLEQMENTGALLDSGSGSDDLAGASRIAPLVYACRQDPGMLDRAVQLQTAMTHNNDTVVECARFFAQLAVDVLNGQAPAAGMTHLLSNGAWSADLSDLVAQGLDSAGGDTRDTIATFGQMCSIEAALPGAVHLICSYEKDFESAIVQNVMAGGDSAARGMLVGTVLGASNGMDAIARRWLDDLSHRSSIDGMLDALDANN